MGRGRRSLDLHHIALEVAQRLLRDPRARAIAVTGSLARGDSGAGSDVDLWVLGSRTCSETLLWRGVPVTLLWQTPHAARQLDTLLRYEVEDAWVLHDPEGLLRRVRMRFWHNRDEIRSFMLNGTASVVYELVAQAAGLPPPGALALLREAARRAAAMAVYLKLGRRVPRHRHFTRHLRRPALRLLDQILSLPVDDACWRRLLRFLQQHEHALKPWRGRSRSFPPPIPTVERLRWVARGGHRADAVLSVRAALHQVPQRRRTPAAVLELWRLVHGFDRVAPTQSSVRRDAHRTTRLVQRLDLERHLDRRWRLRERVLTLARCYAVRD